MPMKCVSRRRRPILSPPGREMTALPKRASRGPTSMTEPRRLAHFFRNSSLPRYSMSTCAARKRYESMPSLETLTPMSRMSWMRLFTSRMSGTLCTVTSSSVSKVAQMICSTSFLAPCGVMSPVRRCPPSMMNDAILVYLFFFLLLLFRLLRLFRLFTLGR